MVRVAVIGCGVLGIKIAGELAFHGHEIRVHDHNPEALDKVQPRLTEERKALREDGLLNQPNFVGSVYCMSRMEETIKEADFIIETIAEDLNAKVELIEAISHCCPPNAVIATSTMRLNIDTIFERSAHKERCLGVRFLFPVYCIPEVEIQLGGHTSIQSLEKVKQFLERMGKTPYFRSGSEPLVLTEQQRDYRKSYHVQLARQMRSLKRKPVFTMPDLGSPDNISTALNAELDDEHSREKDCVVCMDEERNCVLHPCHHLCTCAACGRMLLKRQDACPICRKHISSIFRIFHS